MKKSLIGLMLCISASIYAQELTPDWTFPTSGEVLAGPLISGESVYVGDQKGVFYSIDLNTGKEKWKVETGGNIQAKATLVDDKIFFESANVFYLVDSESGDQLWSFDPETRPFVFKYKEQEWPFKIDPYDDKRSIATYNNGLIYVGCGNGKVYAIDATSGKVEKTYIADENAPVRSSPFVHENHLYFGDWEGMVYCYSLADGELIWKKKTYRGEKPYGTFGSIVSEFLIHNGLLYFGARNHMLNVLEESTGEKDWTYTDKNGGWIIGDPVIYNDTLYMGGSDNFTMYAFGTRWGNPLWTHNNGTKNIYTKAVVTKDWVAYTAGSGYNPAASGFLYLLDRMTGKEVARYETPMTTLSSPAITGNQIVFGCYDSNVYCIKIE